MLEKMTIQRGKWQHEHKKEGVMRENEKTEKKDQKRGKRSAREEKKRGKERKREIDKQEGKRIHKENA